MRKFSLVLFEMDPTNLTNLDGINEAHTSRGYILPRPLRPR